MVFFCCWRIGDCGRRSFIGSILFRQTVLEAIKYTVNLVDIHFSSVSRTTHKFLPRPKTKPVLSRGDTARTPNGEKRDSTRIAFTSVHIKMIISIVSTHTHAPKKKYRDYLLFN